MRTLNTPKFTGNGPLPESTPFGKTPFPLTPATEKQIKFLISLCSERGVDLTVITGQPEFDASKISKKDASAMITDLLNSPKVAAPVKPGTSETPKPAEITEGMYRVSLDNGPKMTIYKVQRAVHGSGNLYAKRLMVDDSVTPADVWFEYAAGVVRRLRPEHKMSLEDAKRFGALYGTCCVCGRTLTDEKSIEAGIGPVCATKF